VVSVEDLHEGQVVVLLLVGEGDDEEDVLVPVELLARGGGQVALKHKQNSSSVHFKKCKLEYQHLLLLETAVGQSSNLYLNVAYYFNTSVN
jgi:hypothetical protein